MVRPVKSALSVDLKASATAIYLRAVVSPQLNSSLSHGSQSPCATSAFAAINSRPISMMQVRATPTRSRIRCARSGNETSNDTWTGLEHQRGRIGRRIGSLHSVASECNAEPGVHMPPHRPVGRPRPLTEHRSASAWRRYWTRSPHLAGRISCRPARSGGACCCWSDNFGRRSIAGRGTADATPACDLRGVIRHVGRNASDVDQDRSDPAIAEVGAGTTHAPDRPARGEHRARRRPRTRPTAAAQLQGHFMPLLTGPPDHRDMARDSRIGRASVGGMPTLGTCYVAGSVAKRWPALKRFKELEHWHHQIVASLDDEAAIPIASAASGADAGGAGNLSD